MREHSSVEIVEKLMKPDSTVTGYEVEIKATGKEKEIELELDVSGNILKTENE